MRQAGVIGIALLGAIPSTAAAAPVVDPISVSRSATVPAGATRSLTLTCPGSAVALHAAATSRLAPIASVPGTNPRRWTFRFASEAPRRASAVLRCVRLRLPVDVERVRLNVGTVRLPDLTVRAGSTIRRAMSCQPGQLPTGWGLAGEAPGVAVAAAIPRRRGWVLRVENTGATEATATMQIRCLQRRQRASSGQEHRFATRLTSFTDRLRGGRLSHSCRPSEFSVATGASVDAADDVLLTRTFPSGGRAGSWVFRAPGGSQVRTSLVCLARDTGFELHS
jgi:hypothetical protein